MTREEAIENLKWLLECSYVDSFEDAENEALEMAIQALENEEITEYYKKLKTITNKAYTWFCPNCGTNLIMVQKEGD